MLTPFKDDVNSVVIAIRPCIPGAADMARAEAEEPHFDRNSRRGPSGSVARDVTTPSLRRGTRRGTRQRRRRPCRMKASPSEMDAGWYTAAATHTDTAF